MLLLIYENFKAQTHERVVAQKVESSEEMKSSYLPLDMEDSAGLHSDDEEEVAKIVKDMGRKKKKKSRKGMERRIKQEVNSKEDYNDEEEGMEMNKEGNVKDVGTSKA